MSRRKKSPPLELLPPSPQAWRIDKKQVVCAELASAIRLFFHGDYIAAHVLGGAALDILRGTARAKGISTSWDEGKHVIADGYEDAFVDLKNADYNFFKHAMTDAGAVRHRYQPTLTAMLLFEASLDFARVYPEISYFETMTFVAWTCLWMPKTLKPGNESYFDKFKNELDVVPESDLWSATAGARRLLKIHDENMDEMERLSPNLLRAGREMHLGL